jgi:TonB family protein
MGPGCVKTREKSSHKKIELSERPQRDFLKVGKGHPTHENFNFLRFYTAWVGTDLSRPSLDFQPVNLLCWLDRLNSAKSGPWSETPAVSITREIGMSFAIKGVIFAAVGLVFTGLGIANAGDKIVPIKAAASSPGNVRTETCARPEYPKGELEQNHQGIVTLRFLLGADGVAKQSLIHTSSGYPGLDEAALVAISKCRFNPPSVDGKAVEGWTAIQYVWKP